MSSDSWGHSQGRRSSSAAGDPKNERERRARKEVGTSDATGKTQSLSTNFAFTVVKAELTAWSEAGGWADPGKAWLAVTWSHDLSLDGEVRPQITSISATLAVAAGSAKATDEVTYQETFRESEERVINVSVPVDTSSADFSVSGSYSVNQPNGSGQSIPGNNAGEFASETTTVSFN